jgi:hypothetical protein
VPRSTTTFPGLRSQRDEMGPGRRWPSDTCRYPVCATIHPRQLRRPRPPILPRLSGCRRPEAVRAASCSSALTAIAGTLGKHKRGYHSLPAHVTPGYRAPGDCMPALRLCFGACMVRRMGPELGLFQVRFDARKRRLTRPAADSRASWPRRCCQGGRMSARHREVQHVGANIRRRGD